jgi:signal transduction histidine kinase
LTIVLLRRWMAAARPLRWALLPALVGALALLVGAAVNILNKLTIDVPDALRWTLLLTFAMVPLAVMVGALRIHLARAGVARLLVELRASAPTLDLRDALARALGDPSLHLAFWLPKLGYYADAHGQPVAVDETRPGRARTYIERSGDRIAVVDHDATLRGEPELLDAVTAAAGMALENGQLQAELKARLEELEGSRARIVEAGQLERKRLERNLHDGTQQRLVLLAMELSVLERELRDDPESSLQVRHARAEIATSLAELRDVARGLYPAGLSTYGLRAALRSAVSRAAVPVALDVQISDSLPEPVEVAAYYVVSESLANVGKHARATSCTVSVIQRDGRLSVEVGDDGIGGVDPTRGSGLLGLRDRVDALGGDLVVGAGVEGGTCLRATLPCGPDVPVADRGEDQPPTSRRIASSRSGVKSDLST